MPFAALKTNLSQLKQDGLLRTRRIVMGAQTRKLKVDSHELLSFASNDYLRLANDPRLINATQEALGAYGVGAGASPMVCGHGVMHELAEQSLAKFVEKPRALLFSNGYLANIGVITALANRETAIFADKLNHASLNDAAVLSRAKFQRYPHANMRFLERLLTQSNAKRKLVISDAVFSMDGDIAPIKALLDLCDRYDAWLVLDDAHGFGVLGASGQGAMSFAQVSSPRIIYMATLGKAAGVYGAFVAAEIDVIDFLLQHARSYIYTTATPQCLASAIHASVELICTEQWRRTHIIALTSALRMKLKLERWQISMCAAAIQPIIIGDNKEVVAVSQALFDQGIWAPAIRSPTVEKNTARLRLSLSASHRLEDVDRLAAALNELERLAKRHGGK